MANKPRIAPEQIAALLVENPSEVWCQEMQLLTRNKYQLLQSTITEIHMTARLLPQLRSHLPANRPLNNAGLSLLCKVGGLF